jgi:hypothetical protein|tara:strand:+ start:1108 stop:1443 length:336 start_codon:yes stop_codon:yes gene_type:complete
MPWLKELFGLDKNLDTIAHEKLGELSIELQNLIKHFRNLVESLKFIEGIKKAGKIPDPAEREYFFRILNVVKIELNRALELELEVEESEETELEREMVSRRKPKGGALSKF